jgi:predicted nucleic acid-binding protein
MRIVLDTNILARANPHSKGVARTLLLTILESADHVLVLWPFLLRETERVLNYPGLEAIWPLKPLDIEQYTQALQDFAELINPQIGTRLAASKHSRNVHYWHSLWGGFGLWLGRFAPSKDGERFVRSW